MQSPCTPPFSLSHCRVNTFLTRSQEHGVLERGGGSGRGWDRAREERKEGDSKEKGELEETDPGRKGEPERERECRSMCGVTSAGRQPCGVKLSQKKNHTHTG